MTMNTPKPEPWSEQHETVAEAAAAGDPVAQEAMGERWTPQPLEKAPRERLTGVGYFGSFWLPNRNAR